MQSTAKSQELIILKLPKSRLRLSLGLIDDFGAFNVRYPESPLQAEVVVLDKGVPLTQEADGAEDKPEKTPQAESGSTTGDDVRSTIEDDNLIHTVPNVQLADSSALSRTLQPAYTE